MKKIISLLVLALFILSFAANSQPWLRSPYLKINNASDKSKLKNFYEIQKAFDLYQKSLAVKEKDNDKDKDKANKKGDDDDDVMPGFMQFQRWKWFMQPRVYPSGDITLPTTNWDEFQKYVKANNINIEKTNWGTNQNVHALTGNWTPMGPFGIPANGDVGRINFITFDPVNYDTIYVGSASGGLWKSTNGGGTWSTNTDQLTLLGCSDLLIDPTNTQVMYLATGDGDAGDNNSVGILKSTDGGATWNTSGLSWTAGDYNRIYKMIMDPLNSSIILAATTNGVYKTIDAGTTWNQTHWGSFTDIEFKTDDPSIVFAVKSNGCLYYLSTNMGNTFTNITAGLPDSSNIDRYALAVTPADPATVYILAGSSSSDGYYGIYKSTNIGNSFTVQSTTPNIMGWTTDGSDSGGQGWYDLSIAVNPANANDVIIGGVDQWRSTDGGVNWTCLSNWYPGAGVPYVHADVHALEYLPGSSTTLFSGNDGGVFKSTDHGATWTDLGGGLTVSQMYRLGTSATNPNQTIMGLQDNGTMYINHTNWSEVIGGDGMECMIDYNDSNIMYGEYYYGDIIKSNDGGNNFNIEIASTGGTGVNEDGQWVTPYIMHPTHHLTLIVGKTQVYQTKDTGTTWTQLGTIPPPSGSDSWDNTLLALAYAPSNPAYIYAARYMSMFVTKDSGATWTDITAGLPVSSAYITYIAVSNTDPKKVWVTFSGYSSNDKVYFSSNGGNSWSDFSTGLPNLPADCIVYQNNTDNGLYVGMDVGVYFRSDTLSSWQPYLTGLPNVISDELEIQYSSGKLRNATFGRGLWESDAAIPIPMFTAIPTSICIGSTVNFTDHSLDSPSSWTWTFQGGTPATSVMQNPTVVYNTPGVYRVTLKVANANGSSYKTINSYITVDSPIAVVTANYATGVVTSNEPTGNQWYMNGTLIPGATNQTYTITTNGTYYDIVTISGCPSDTSNVISYFAGINEYSSENGITIYPNPANDNITIKIEDLRFENLELRINDIVGNTVFVKTLYNKITNIDISALAKGMYFVEVKTERGVAVKKFIKE